MLSTFFREFTTQSNTACGSNRRTTEGKLLVTQWKKYILMKSFLLDEHHAQMNQRGNICKKSTCYFQYTVNLRRHHSCFQQGQAGSSQTFLTLTYLEFGKTFNSLQRSQYSQHPQRLDSADVFSLTAPPIHIRRNNNTQWHKHTHTHSH